MRNLLLIGGLSLGAFFLRRLWTKPAVYLSPHFTLAELTRTSSGLDNTPSQEIVKNLKAIGADLEIIRAQFGPLQITSGYRSAQVNEFVKGAKSSAHLYGSAVDFVPLRDGVTIGEIAIWVAKMSGLKYDQVIAEETAGGSKWVHYGKAPPWLSAPRYALLRKLPNEEPKSWQV